MRCVWVLTLLGIVASLATLGCGMGSIPDAHADCTSGFKNDTQGVLSDADLETAWSHAQWTIANGHWVINAIDCDNRFNPEPPPCQYMPADKTANTATPNCVGVRGTQGPPAEGADGITSGNSIAINISKGHDRAWALAAYEFENVIGCSRLNYDCGNR